MKSLNGAFKDIFAKLMVIYTELSLVAAKIYEAPK